MGEGGSIVSMAEERGDRWGGVRVNIRTQGQQLTPDSFTGSICSCQAFMLSREMPSVFRCRAPGQDTHTKASLTLTTTTLPPMPRISLVLGWRM